MSSSSSSSSIVGRGARLGARGAGTAAAARRSRSRTRRAGRRRLRAIHQRVELRPASSDGSCARRSRVGGTPVEDRHVVRARPRRIVRRAPRCRRRAGAARRGTAARTTCRAAGRRRSRGTRGARAAACADRRSPAAIFASAGCACSRSNMKIRAGQPGLAPRRPRRARAARAPRDDLPGRRGRVAVSATCNDRHPPG